MIGTRTNAARAALILAALAAAACGSTAAVDGDARADSDQPREAAAIATVAGRRVGPIQFREYTGAAAADPRLAPAIARMAAIVDPTIVAAENRAGIAFLPDRDAVVMLSDRPVPGGGDVNARLVDGIRRPVIRIEVRALLAEEFLPESHFRALIVEAAVVASAGDHVPPAWLRVGLGPVLTDTFDRLLHERALGGASVRSATTEIFPPAPGNDDPLRAAAQVRALERIARGDRPLARFVAARLEGQSEVAALDAVGVQDTAFLEAAAETERDRALAGLAEGGPLQALADARLALDRGDPGKATTHVALIEAELAAGALSPWFEADSRLVLAEYALVVGDLVRARQLAAAALGAPTYLVRVREARLCEARAARANGDTRAASRLFRGYLTDFPDAPGSDEARAALGVDEELAARLPGIASELSSENSKIRAKAAVRLGETGDPSVAEPLRRLTADEDSDVRRLAYAALALAVGADATEDLGAGTRDVDPAVRGAALSMLAFADVERGTARARELESDASPEVRTVVERILAPVREREAAAERVQLEHDAAQVERREKAAALERARRAKAELLADEERERVQAADRARRDAEARKPDPLPIAGTGSSGADTPPKPTPPERMRDRPLPPPRPPRPLPRPDDPKQEDGVGGDS